MKMMKTQRMHEMKQNLVAVSFLVVLLLFIGLLYVGTTGPAIEKYTQCKGIENFYTGGGFVVDAINLANHAHYASGINPKPPQAIWDNESVDCKTISPALSCLAKLYNDTECSYYMSLTVDLIEEPIGHLGLKCRTIRTDNNGSLEYSQWFALY
jgi:hypothetical protein